MLLFYNFLITFKIYFFFYKIISQIYFRKQLHYVVWGTCQFAKKSTRKSQLARKVKKKFAQFSEQKIFEF